MKQVSPWYLPVCVISDTKHPDITGIILAGGQGSRLAGADKGLLKFLNKPLIEYSLAALTPCVDSVYISANRNLEQYQKYSPVVPDELGNFQGPLSGIASVIKLVKTPYILILPCDTPYINSEVLTGLIQHGLSNDADVCIVDDGEQKQPMIALIKTELAKDLNAFLATGGRKLRQWYQQHKQISFICPYPELFTNFNTPADFDLTLED